MDGFSYPIGDYDDNSPCPGPQMKLFQTVLWAILAHVPSPQPGFRGRPKSKRL